jgi:hypothetical protein
MLFAGQMIPAANVTHSAKVGNAVHGDLAVSVSNWNKNLRPPALK